MDELNKNGIAGVGIALAVIAVYLVFIGSPKLTDAVHLDSNKNFIGNIYDKVVEKDNEWSENIDPDEYVRITFERSLNYTNNIRIYAKAVTTSDIEIYAENGSTVIAVIGNISKKDYYMVNLDGLEGNQSTFDLKIVGSPVKFDLIIDPTYSISIALLGGQSFINWRPQNFTAQTIEPFLQNATASQCIMTVTNTGDNATLEIGRSANSSTIQVQCDDDATIAGAVNLTDQYQNIKTNFTSLSTVDICCWAVLTANFNVTSFGEISLNTY